MLRCYSLPLLVFAYRVLGFAQSGAPGSIDAAVHLAEEHKAKAASDARERSQKIPTFAQGLAFYRGGRINEATEAFSALRQNGDNSPLLDFYQGVCLAKLGDLPAASRMLTTYVAAQFADPHGWYWLSRVQLLQKQFSEAHASVQHAINLDPKSSQCFRTLGEVELELNNTDAAYRAWTTANQLNPGDAPTKYHLGRLFFEAEFFEEAANWFRETLRLAPAHFGAMTYLGLCAEYLGDNSTAESLYRKAIQQSRLQKAPYAWAYLNYAKLLREIGQGREALSVLEESEKLCPDAKALSLLGQLLAVEHESRAEKILRQAILLDPNLSEAHYRLSLLLRSQGKTDEAGSEMALFEQTKKMEERTRKSISAIRGPMQIRN